MAKDPIVIGNGLTYYPLDETFIFVDGRKQFVMFPKNLVGYITTNEYKQPSKSKMPTDKNKYKFNVGFTLYFYTRKNILLLSLKCKTENELSSCIQNIMRPSIQMFKQNKLNVSVERMENNER